MQTMKLGFLASHRGSNMQSVIDACKSGELVAVPAVVISNNGDSVALDRAENEGIPAFHISIKTCADEDVVDTTICNTLIEHSVDLVILAGFMKKLGPITLEKFQGRIINIHPSLLPKFGGQGMFGRKVHEAVLAAGEKETGATIHVVADEYDSGPILAQRRIEVLEDDTVESLSGRLLPIEHELYIDTVKKIIAGEISLDTPGNLSGGLP